MVDIQSVAAEIRRGKKKEDRYIDRKKLQGKNIMAPRITYGGHNKRVQCHKMTITFAANTCCSSSTWSIGRTLKQIQFGSVRCILQHEVLRGLGLLEEAGFNPHQSCPLEMENERKCFGWLTQITGAATL